MKSFIALFAIIAVVAAQPGLLPLGRATTIAGPSGVINSVEGSAAIGAPLGVSPLGLAAPIGVPIAARSIVSPVSPLGLGLASPLGLGLANPLGLGLANPLGLGLANPLGLGLTVL